MNETREDFGMFLIYAFDLMFLNLNLSMCLTKYHTMGNGSIAPHILTSALDGGEWSALPSYRFNPTVRAPRTHWIGGFSGRRRKQKRNPIYAPDGN
jgi:hypothetical protein